MKKIFQRDGQKAIKYVAFSFDHFFLIIITNKTVELYCLVFTLFQSGFLNLKCLSKTVLVFLKDSIIMLLSFGIVLHTLEDNFASYLDSPTYLI